MKLYCITYWDDMQELGEPVGQREKWVGTQVEQSKEAKLLKSEGMTEIVKHQVDVPTGKSGLLQFLNTHQVRP